ncbi:ribonucleotide-diphosphate reductase subunit beta [Croceicoccus estronivorus]|uniref:50S ribosomal protein L11 methyltransferase n=1 Tax=Croceicoccus estronivorus TaxID=1172626 RepID=UPI0008373AB8|nr:50S ribosomal protein L11 methyltransferase [Croceicoccus estronivorus]OCC23115.1 ribonucleotide-diphosphate reductase subunit beta [Croceicoccus estronivorus]
MNETWKITVAAPRPIIQSALLAHEEALEWDFDIVLSGSEITEDHPEDWHLEAWLPRKPSRADKKAIAALFGNHDPDLVVEKLPDQDWVTLSQQGVEPIRAGRFHVRTPNFPPLDEPGVVDFLIPASQAFGTGQHETTAGCLAMLDGMKREGVVVRNLADIGTGTGLLAFAGMTLWPHALATASDIDAVCADVVADNAAMNRVALGAGPNALTMAIADGMDDPLLQARAPYDLLIANILAGPLVELAADFAKAVIPGGSILLAGLLAAQELQVRRAYSRAGMRLAARMTNGDWSILWLRKRAMAKPRATRAHKLPVWARQW